MIRLVGALRVEIKDEVIAAETPHIAAAELTDDTTERALPAAPRH